MTTQARVRPRAHSASSTQVLRVIRTGSSGATVTIVQQDDGQLVAIKTAQTPRVSAQRQAAARDAVAPYFAGRLPEVLFAASDRGTDVLVTRCPSTTTFADAVTEDSGRAETHLGVWEDFVTHLRRVWTASSRPGFNPRLATRNHELRWQRARDGLDMAGQSLGFPNGAWRHLVVNDSDHGSLQSVLGRLADMPAPSMHVTCQGDPQPRNVLLDDAGRWHLVDWEWAGDHHDWRMLVSHLIGWWYVEKLLNQARGSSIPTGPALLLDYQQPDTADIAAWIPTVVETFHAMTDNEHHDDLRALSAHLSMLLIREIPRAVAQGRTHLFAPLLGEAVRLVDAMEGRSPHPLLTPFTSGQRARGAAL
ncbi:hypothetical protein GCM10028784_39400 [Myceligenerans cantabricum]